MKKIAVTLAFGAALWAAVLPAHAQFGFRGGFNLFGTAWSRRRARGVLPPGLFPLRRANGCE